MPKKLLRLLLVLAIALAVPVQGVAAVAAGLCMELGHHQNGQASAHDHSAGQAHDVHKSPSAGGDSKPAGDKSADGSHCPPCVSCCAAAVIAPAAHISIPDSFPAAAITATQYSIAGVLPEKLDRPPLAL